MNRVNVFAIHRCINEGYGLIQIFTEKIRISPTKLWHVCHCEWFTWELIYNRKITRPKCNYHMKFDWQKCVKS